MIVLCKEETCMHNGRGVCTRPTALKISAGRFSVFDPYPPYCGDYEEFKTTKDDKCTNTDRQTNTS